MERKSQVDELIAKLHALSTEYVEDVDDEEQFQRMAEIFAAANYLAGEMRAYLIEVGFEEDSLDRLESYYHNEGLSEVEKALREVVLLD